ncbi:unnamed protein product [Spirodela intermedia]|uniref:PB1 domain-containing protein n=1 Tax=Spirodela intermedia TaxID=51605 RepID=A0A7I8K8J5_SPIIN|nr:unnamed protein product [Spirodela intermedia]
MTAPQAETPHHHGSGSGNSPGSGEDSSPLSRGTDGDISSSGGAAWDDVPPPPPPHPSHRHGLPAHPSAGQRVKFMCSYGGRIQPRAHDNQLTYVGGDTKIVAVDRSVRFPQLLARLAALTPAGPGGSGDFCFRYQLPGEDLDALISVTDDEDVEHMMVEYDRLQRSPSKPARLRLFLFFAAAGRTPSVADAAAAGLSSNLRPSDRQWFVDALNSVPAPPALRTEPIAASVSPPVVALGNPDFLFGLEEGIGNFSSPPTVHDSVQEGKATADAPPTGGSIPAAATGSGSTMEDDWVGGPGEPLVSSSSQPEIHQCPKQELEALQVGNGQQEASPAGAADWQEQQQQRPPKGTDEEIIPTGYPLSAVEYYPLPNDQSAPEKAPAAHQIPFAYLQESVLSNGGAVYASMARLDQPIYVIPSPSPQGIYPGPALPALNNSQSSRDCYYAAAATTQSVTPRGALQQPPYLVSPPQQPSTKTVARYAKHGPVEGNGVAGGAAPPQLLTAYDVVGRPLYVCVRQGTPPAGGSVMSAYQAKAATGGEDQRRSTTGQPPPPPPHLATAVGSSSTAATMAQLLNPEVKPAAKPLQAS